MKKSKLRRCMSEVYDGLVFFEDPSFDNSIIGVSNDSRVIYDYEKMVEEYAKDHNCDIFEAADVVSYDSIRSLTYQPSPQKPIVLFNIEEFK